MTGFTLVVIAIVAFGYVLMLLFKKSVEHTPVLKRNLNDPHLWENQIDK